MLSLQAKPFNCPEVSHTNDPNTFHQSNQDLDQGTWYTTRNPRKQKVAVDREHKKLGHKNQGGNVKGARKDRKPDRQLYIVREKRADNQKHSGNGKIQKNLGDSNGDVLAGVDSGLETVKDSEEMGYDDDRSFVSDVSTAISDKLKNLDSDKAARNDDFKDMLAQGNGPVEMRVLFTMCLGPEENYETVLIYEGETDYEGFLDQVCERHGITDRTALYFKINILQMVRDMHSDPSQVEPTLNKLLDINYNILMAEVDMEEEDTSPLFYGENRDFLGEDSNENSC